jgi:nucleotide-binding universal stress UspA family protein
VSSVADAVTAQVIAEEAERAQQNEERKLRRYLNKHRRSVTGQGVETSVLVRTGEPAERIMNTCEEQGIDLVVMATRGHGGMRRAVLGSVADSVLRESGVPVLTITT